MAIRVQGLKLMLPHSRRKNVPVSQAETKKETGGVSQRQTSRQVRT